MLLFLGRGVCTTGRRPTQHSSCVQQQQSDMLRGVLRIASHNIMDGLFMPSLLAQYRAHQRCATSKLHAVCIQEAVPQAADAIAGALGPTFAVLAHPRAPRLAIVYDAARLRLSSPLRLISLPLLESIPSWQRLYTNAAEQRHALVGSFDWLDARRSSHAGRRRSSSRNSSSSSRRSRRSSRRSSRRGSSRSSRQRRRRRRSRNKRSSSKPSTTSRHPSRSRHHPSPWKRQRQHTSRFDWESPPRRHPPLRPSCRRHRPPLSAGQRQRTC